jgi:hypothetical protein
MRWCHLLLFPTTVRILTSLLSRHLVGQGGRYCCHVQRYIWRRNVRSHRYICVCIVFEASNRIVPGQTARGCNIVVLPTHLCLSTRLLIVFLHCMSRSSSYRWSTRGVGLTRVLAAIRVRSGPTVKLVLESPKQYAKSRDVTTQQLKQREDAAKAAQDRKDRLLVELQETEAKIKKGKFLGLF